MLDPHASQLINDIKHVKLSRHGPAGASWSLIDEKDYLLLAVSLPREDSVGSIFELLAAMDPTSTLFMPTLPQIVSLLAILTARSL